MRRWSNRTDETKHYAAIPKEPNVRALQGTYVPKRGTRVTLYQLVHEYGWGLTFIDRLLAGRVIVWTGRHYIFQ